MCYITKISDNCDKIPQNKQLTVSQILCVDLIKSARGLARDLMNQDGRFTRFVKLISDELQDLIPPGQCTL